MSTATVKVRLVGAEILTQDLGKEADFLTTQQQHLALLQQTEQYRH
jgi:hypothetical protein